MKDPFVIANYEMGST